MGNMTSIFFIFLFLFILPPCNYERRAANGCEETGKRQDREGVLWKGREREINAREERGMKERNVEKDTNKTRTIGSFSFKMVKGTKLGNSHNKKKPGRGKEK